MSKRYNVDISYYEYDPKQEEFFLRKVLIPQIPFDQVLFLRFLASNGIFKIEKEFYFEI